MTHGRRGSPTPWPDRLRVGAAALLLASGVAFLIGSHEERAGHHETAAEHAMETAPTPSGAPAPSPTLAAPTPTHAAVAPTATKDPRLSAPEGSKEREAGERAARQAKASAAPTRASAAPTVTASAHLAEAVPSATATQAPEGSAAREAAERADNGSTPGGTASPVESSERLFGINTESTALIGAALAVTSALALLLLFAPSRRLRRITAGAAVLFCLSASALDVREVTHQQALGRTHVVVAAVIVLLLHVIAGVLSALVVVYCPPDRAIPGAIGPVYVD